MEMNAGFLVFFLEKSTANADTVYSELKQNTGKGKTFLCLKSCHREMGALKMSFECVLIVAQTSPKTLWSTRPSNAKLIN